MVQWSSYQHHALMDVSSSLAPSPSLLVWVKRYSNRAMRGLNGQSLENSLHQVRRKTYLFSTTEENRLRIQIQFLFPLEEEHRALFTVY